MGGKTLVGPLSQDYGACNLMIKKTYTYTHNRLQAVDILPKERGTIHKSKDLCEDEEDNQNGRQYEEGETMVAAGEREQNVKQY